MNSMFDLAIHPRADGAFDLEQQAGSLDEPAVVKLHPAQVRLLAEMAGLLPAPDPELLDRLGAAHARRIRYLVSRIDELCDGYYAEILDQCGAGLEIALHLRAISDLASDLATDLGPNPCEIDSAERNENSAGISVTSETKRGRPTTGNALSNAERQRRHRESAAGRADPAEGREGPGAPEESQLNRQGSLLPAQTT